MGGDALPQGWVRGAVGSLLALDQPGTWGPEAGSDPVPVLRSTNMTKDGRLTLTNIAMRDVPERDRDRKRLREGDIILERSGGSPGQPVGRVARFQKSDGAYCGNFCQQLRADSTVCDPGFLYRVLWRLYEVGVTGRLQRATTGIRNLDYGAYQATKVLLPPLVEQRGIAAILDAIDAAIERSQVVIAEVEHVRKAMLQQLLTRGMPGWHTEYKDVPGIGSIPADWEVVRGERMVGLSGGYAPSDFDFTPDGKTLFLKVDDLNEEGQSRYVRTARFRWDIDGSRVKPMAPPVIVFPKRGAAIFTNRVAIVQVPSVVDPNLMTVTPREAVDIEFLRYLLLHVRLHKICDNSGIPQINNKHIYPKLFPLPPMTEQKAIAALLSSAEDIGGAEAAVQAKLSRAKAQVAEALLSGQVRVPVAKEVGDG